MDSALLHVYEFGPAVLDERAQSLQIQGLVVDLQPQSWRLLLALVQHEGHLIPKSDLESAVWHGRYVGENVLAAAVTRLRHALGEGLQGLIESVPKRGYRLTLPVTKRPLSGAAHPQLALSAGMQVPGWPQYQLLKKMSDSAQAEVWVACPAGQSAQVGLAMDEGRRPTGDVKVFKFAVQPAAVAALQREVSLLRALRQGAAEPDRFVSLTHWQFGESLNAMGTDWAGVPLDVWWRREGRGEALDEAARRALMLALVEAVAQAHALGVVHRDLKPGNVLLQGDATGWTLRLCDFGTARSLDPELWAGVDLATLTAEQTLALMQDDQGGTMFYMAPECLLGHPSSERSDVYALGLILYQLWTGKWGQPLLVGWERDVQDPELRDDIASCTDGDVRQRLEHAGALLRRLQQHEQRREAREQAARERAHQAAVEEALHRQRARRPWMVAAVLTLVAGLLGTGLAYWRLQVSEGRLARETRDLRALNHFYARDFLASSDPQGAGRFKVSVEAALERATQLLDKPDGPYSPQVRALVHGQLQDAYLDAGHLPQAVMHGERALSMGRQLSERDIEQERSVALSLAKAEIKLGHLDRASQLLDELQGQQPVSQWGDREAVYFWARRAEVAGARSRGDLSIGFYQEAVKVLSKVGPDQASFRERNMLAVRSGLAEAMRAQGDAAGAVRELDALLLEVKALKERHDMKYCILQALLAGSLGDDGQLPRAVQAAQDSLACLAAAGAEGTYWDGQAHRALGLAYWKQAKLPLAREALDHAVLTIAKTRGEASHVTFSAQEDAAVVRVDMGDASGAHERLVSLAARAEAVMGPKEPLVHHVRYSLALAKLAMGRRQGLKETVAALDQALLREAETDEGWPLRMAVLRTRTALLFGEREQAAVAWEQARQARAALPKGLPELHAAYDELARTMAR